ncbi:MAG: carboxypeptidase-like regulatory domain-containing protein [Bacteroidia bacterium]
MKKIINLLLLSFLVATNACKKEENEENSGGTGSIVQTTFSGRVTDKNGVAVSGATVTFGNQTTTTNFWGIFLFENAHVNSERALVFVEKPGYWKYSGSVKPLANSLTQMRVCLLGDVQTHMVNALSGGIITDANGAKISFPPDAFEDLNGNTYTGNVSVTFHSTLLNDSRYPHKFPGSDGKAKKGDGNATYLAPYGELGATLKDLSGNTLKIKAGKKATISIPLLPSQQSNAATSTKLWHFNEATGIWEEEGSAQRNGNEYTGEISHFSWWCYSDPDAVLVYGQLLDCQGGPLDCGSVVTDSNYYLADSYINGWYCFQAPPNYTFQIKGWYYGYWIQEYTNLVTVPAQAPYGTYTIPPIQFVYAGCETHITGHVVNCGNVPANATIALIQNNQLVDFQYSMNGSFDFFLPDTSNSTFTVFAYKGIYSGSTSITTFPLSHNDVGYISLCDTTPITNNVLLNFNSPITGNIPISFDVNSAEIVQNGSAYEITVNYTDSASQTTGVFKITTAAYAPGIYNWNGTTNTISGSLSFAGINYSITPSATTGTTTLSSTPPIGGNISGIFSGPVTLTTTGLPTLSGTLSGSFDVMRSQ